MDSDRATHHTIAVAGASGHVGSHLVPELLRHGYVVRALTRDPDAFDVPPEVEHSVLQVAEADLLDPDLQELATTLAGCDVAYYLVHSMAGESEDAFVERDLQAARHFGAAAQLAGIERVIYLGGLGPAGEDGLSAQLRSRHATGDALREADIAVTELRAGIIIGAGSASFEMVRTLAQLPLLLAPEEIDALCEPIAVEDVVDYLVGCLASPSTAGRTYEIGSGEVISYRHLIEECARVMGRTTKVVTVSVPSLALFAHSLSVLTRMDLGLVRPLIEGMGVDLVTREEELQQLLEVDRLTVREAVEQAIDEDPPSSLLRMPEPGDVRRATAPLAATTLQVARDMLSSGFRALPRIVDGVSDGAADSALGEAHAPVEVQRSRLGHYLQDAVAMERNVLLMLTTEIETTRNPMMRERLVEHLEETRGQEELLLDCCARLGVQPPVGRQTAALSFAAVKGMWNFLRGDKSLKNLRDLYIVEHGEIAGYELLLRLASAAGEPEIEAAIATILEQERAMAEDIEAWWDEPFRGLEQEVDATMGVLP